MQKSQVGVIENKGSELHGRLPWAGSNTKTAVEVCAIISVRRRPLAVKTKRKGHGCPRPFPQNVTRDSKPLGLSRSRLCRALVGRSRSGGTTACRIRATRRSACTSSIRRPR